MLLPKVMEPPEQGTPMNGTMRYTRLQGAEVSASCLLMFLKVPALCQALLESFLALCENYGLVHEKVVSSLRELLPLLWLQVYFFSAAVKRSTFLSLEAYS